MYYANEFHFHNNRKGCFPTHAFGPVLRSPSPRCRRGSPSRSGAGTQRVPRHSGQQFSHRRGLQQEAGVVQHISTFTYFGNSHNWLYTFTQEWPVPRHVRHQLSYTLAATRLGDYSKDGAGIGDVFLHYRYQLIGNGESRFAFSPRASLILPSGNSRLGRGYGGAGVQTSLPASLVLSRKLVTHWNVGATLIPHA